MTSAGARLLSALALMTTAVAGGVAAAEPPQDDYYQGVSYGARNTFELGGALAVSWTSDLFTLDFGPSVGWFVADMFELSAFIRVDYENDKAADGSRSSTTTASVVLEPSYHWALKPGLVYAFGGLGVGVAHDATDFQLKTVPRVGVNIEIGRSGVINPGIRVPILLGPNSGPTGDDFGVDAGFEFEMSYTTFF